MLKLLLVVIVVAVAVYLAVRVLQDGGLPGRGGRPARPAPPRRPVAPDDDEEFLRELERKRRHPEDPDVP